MLCERMKRCKSYLVLKGLFGAFNDIRLQQAKVRRYVKCGQGDRLSPLKAVGIIYSTRSGYELFFNTPWRQKQTF